MRTTLDIDEPILRELKRLRAKEGKSLGRLASDLLARALKEDAVPPADPPPTWITKPMGARANLSDKDAVYRALER